jgi:hypothetical protein
MEKPATRTTEFEAFKRLAKGLVSVPKKEVERKAVVRKARKKRRS